MPYIPWSESYSVYNNFVDAQHKQLIESLNNLYALREQSQPMPKQLAALDELIAYTKSHFKTEEVLMQATSFPDIAVHQQEHEDLLTSLAVERSHVSKDQKDISDDLFLRLRSVVVDHMQTTDKNFGQHLKLFMEQNPDAPLPAIED